MWIVYTIVVVFLGLLAWTVVDSNRNGDEE